MKLLFVPLFVVAAVLSPAATSAYEVTPADQAFLADVLLAVEKKDAAWIAGRTLLPIAVGFGKERRVVKSERDFRAIVARSLSPDLVQRMRADAKDPLFKNWRGVMLGDGILWFTERRGADRAPWRYVILAFGGFSFQPSDEKS